jgi:hypothetical protein
MMKVLAVSQCVKRSKPLKRVIVRPDRPLDNLDRAAHGIEDDQEQEHAEDGDAANPAQRLLMEGAPVLAGRLDQRRRSRDREC